LLFHGLDGEAEGDDHDEAEGAVEEDGCHHLGGS
jgi:hypothetical protein